MARVVVAPAAIADLDQLIRTLNLPGDTRSRVKARLMQLAEFPEAGTRLGGRWDGFRFILGPWPWMLLLYNTFTPVSVQPPLTTFALTTTCPVCSAM